jgi:hypothetical protein
VEALGQNSSLVMPSLTVSRALDFPHDLISFLFKGREFGKVSSRALEGVFFLNYLLEGRHAF